MADPLPIAVLISGGGTTLQNLLDRCADGSLPARVVRVVSSRADAFGVERARRAGVPTDVVRRKDFPSAAAFSDRIFDIVRASGAKLACLGGFLQLLVIPPDFAGRVLTSTRRSCRRSAAGACTAGTCTKPYSRPASR